MEYGLAGRVSPTIVQLGKHTKLKTLPKVRIQVLSRRISTEDASSPTFQPRETFPSYPSLPRSYYLGHHAKALSKLRTLASQTDLVLECRDYRIPLSSRNPLLERAMAGVERIIVYTKWDLGRLRGVDRVADKNELIMKAWTRESEGNVKMCFLGRDAERKGKGGLGTIKSLLAMIKDSARQRWSLTGTRVLVAGIPNVGKSTLLNALRAQGVRKGKVAQTGGSPGVTRNVGSLVKIIDGKDLDVQSNDTSNSTDMDIPKTEASSEGVYVLDTPGIFMPYVASQDTMLKLALCGNVKETLVPPTVLADYLLFRINLVDPQLYAKHFLDGRPTNDINELLRAIATKTGRLIKSNTKKRKERRAKKAQKLALEAGDQEAYIQDAFGQYQDDDGSNFDIEATSLWFVQRWRTGHLGRFALDEISEDATEQWSANEMDKKPSISQAKKLYREDRKERMRAKMKTS